MQATSELLDWHELVQENSSLRAMIAELLITNQELRWQLLARREPPHLCAGRSASALREELPSSDPAL